MNTLAIYSCNSFFNYLNSLLSPLPSTSGDGKTHYIQQQLACSPASLTIAVNEAFTPLNAISKLRTLPLNQKNCAIFFNFTMLPPGVSGKKRESWVCSLSCRYLAQLLPADSDIHGNEVLTTPFPLSFSLFHSLFTSKESVDESERVHHQQLMEVIGWFFFYLLMLGYVEDSDTGLSFRIPGGLAWAVYVEVCVFWCMK